MDTNKQNKTLEDRFVREAEVRQITGLSRSTRWRLAREGKFPIPVSLGENAVAWRWSDLKLWMDSRQPRGV